MRSCSVLLAVAGIGVLSSGCGRSYAGQATATVAAFVPAGQTVHETHRATFQVEGREVALTHVEYGELMDCASGCFASSVCAIEDPSATAPLLFYAAWNRDAEAPPGMSTACPGLEGRETWPDCEPPGLTHAVTRTAEFSRFAEEQIGAGDLRFCLNRYEGRF